MDFRLSEDQLALQETARKFAQNELPALAETIESTSSPVPHDWLKRYAEMGFLGINTPEALGGLGLTLLDALIVMEEFAKISVGVAFPVRSEEHTSELQSLMRISYAVFCLKKKNNKDNNNTLTQYTNHKHT